MKVLVRLAMIVATLLLVANMSFAAMDCDERVCYDVTVTPEGEVSHYEGWSVCLYDNGTGYLNGATPLALFGGGPTGFMFGAHPEWVTWILHSPVLSGYIWTSVFGTYLSGEGYNITASKRWTVRGMKVPCL